MRQVAPPERPTLMVWVGGAAIVLALAAAIAVGAFFVFRYDASAPVTEVLVPDRPTLLREVSLRAGPRAGDATLSRLPSGMEVTLIGRSADRLWLVVAPSDQPNLVGWVPADTVGGAGDPADLAVVAGSGSDSQPTATVAGVAPTSPVNPTFTPDLPDLAIESVSSHENRLAVSVVNIGAGDVTGRVLVTVNGGEPLEIGAKPGEPLRAGARIDWVLPNEYVQRRAVALVAVMVDPPIHEESLDNNTLEAIVSPDLPIDLEITGAENVPPDQHLRATLRNDSTIPIVGTATVTVRTTDGTSTLLGRKDVALELAPQGTLAIDFPNVTNVDFTRAQLLLVTEAVNDAVARNNVFPR